MLYEQINLEDYSQTGEGGTAIAYTNRNGRTLAKLFSPGFAADEARKEFLTGRVVYEMGLPTPEPIRLITDGTRYGAEYELIVGKRSFTRIISDDRVKSLFHISAETLRRHWDIFTRAYWNTDDPAELEARTKALYPYVALKLTAFVSKLHDGKGPLSESLIRMISNYLR